jgi:Leucine-rich repeat (LRR) protein
MADTLIINRVENCGNENRKEKKKKKKKEDKKLSIKPSDGITDLSLVEDGTSSTYDITPPLMEIKEITQIATKSQQKKKKSGKKGKHLVQSQGDKSVTNLGSFGPLSEMPDQQDRKMTPLEMKALKASNTLLDSYSHDSLPFSSRNNFDFQEDCFGSVERTREGKVRNGEPIRFQQIPSSEDSSHGYGSSSALQKFSEQHIGQPKDIFSSKTGPNVNLKPDDTFLIDSFGISNNSSLGVRSRNTSTLEVDDQELTDRKVIDRKNNGKDQRKIMKYGEVPTSFNTTHNEDGAFDLGNTNYSQKARFSSESTLLMKGSKKMQKEIAFPLSTVFTQPNLKFSDQNSDSGSQCNVANDDSISFELSPRARVIHEKALAASQNQTRQTKGNRHGVLDNNQSLPIVNPNDEQADMLIRYLRSMGTDYESSLEIVSRFREEQAKNATGLAIIPTPTSVRSPQGKVTRYNDENPASLAMSAKQNNIMGRRERARSRLAQRGLLWERSSQPGAVQVEGRAFGAPVRPDLPSEPKNEDHVIEAVEAMPVEVVDQTPVVYADSTPLSWKELLKENAIRRRICLLFFLLVTVVTISVSLVVFKGPGSIADDISFETASPSHPPSSAPTFISPDILNYTANLSGLKQVTTSESPQNLAVGWLSTFDTFSDDLGEMFDQRYALVTFYFAVGGSNWVEKENWLQPDIHECDWSGAISCTVDGTGRRIVNGLDLTRNGLLGVLPRELRLCQHLEGLRLSKNRVQGSISSEIFHLSSLEVLDLSSNELTGSLPSDIGNEDSLVYLDVSFNSLTGSIPDSLRNLRLLRVADFTNNQLTGSLPSYLTELAMISRLSLSSNLFSGTLPLYPANSLPAFDVLDLGDNQLTGTLPPWMLLLLQRQELLFNSNFFSGTIPSPLDDPEVSLILFESKFWEGIKLRRIDISDNELSGTVPEWGRLLPTVEFVDFSNNKFNGTIPFTSDKTQWASLEYVYLANNQFSGEIPISWPSKIKLLDISGNNLHGTLNESLLRSSSELQFLLLENNTKLLFDLNKLLRYSRNIKTLNLKNTSLSGKINAGDVQNLASIEIFDLSYNRISGTIPEVIGNLTTLKKISLCNNQLSGSIPSQVGMLKYLQGLHLEENLLTGSLPQTLSEMTSLESLELGGNNLSGSIPESLCSSEKLNLTLRNIGCQLKCECCTAGGAEC